MTGKRNSLSGVVKLCNRRIAELEAENKRLREAASRVVKRYDNIGRIDLSPLRAALKETADE